MPDVPDLLCTEAGNLPRGFTATVPSFGGGVLADAKKATFYLGKDGEVTCHVSDDARRLQIEFDVDKEGLTKTGVNGLIDALIKIRDMMVR
jgi:hypothetical protein